MVPPGDVPPRPDGVDPDSDPFRLADEPAVSPASVSPAIGAPNSGALAPRVFVPPPSPLEAPRERVHPDGVRPEVSTATVRERKDPGSVSRPGPLAPPPGWPQEMWRYPLRGRGVRELAAASLLVAVGDLVAAWNGFLGALLALPLVVIVLRWQVRSISTTATGADEVPPLFDPKDFEVDALGALLRMALRALAYVAPAGFVLLIGWLRDPKGPGPTTGDWVIATALGAVGLWLWPVLLFAEALHSPDLGWPWRAFPWAIRGARACALLAGAWALLVFGEWLALPLARLPLWAAVPLLVAWRGGALAVGLVGARGLGVMGRGYEP